MEGSFRPDTQRESRMGLSNAKQNQVAAIVWRGTWDEVGFNQIRVVAVTWGGMKSVGDERVMPLEDERREWGLFV